MRGLILAAVLALAACGGKGYGELVAERAEFEPKIEKISFDEGKTVYEFIPKGNRHYVCVVVSSHSGLGVSCFKRGLLD